MGNNSESTTSPSSESDGHVRANVQDTGSKGETYTNSNNSRFLKTHKTEGELCTRYAPRDESPSPKESTGD